MWKQRRSGIWQTRVGNRQVSLKTTNSKVAAQREAKLKTDFGDAVFGLRKSSKIIFHDLAQQFLKSLKDTRNNPKKFERKTFAIRRRLEQHIYPEFSNDTILMIKASRVKKWADRLAVDHGADGVNRIVTVMRSIIKWGVRNDSMGLPFDPVNHWPRYQAAKDKWTTLTADEVEAVLTADDPALLRILPMLKVALFTGMRLENVVLLKWNQVNLEHGYIQIKANDTKQGDILTVPLLPEAEEVLITQKGMHPEFVFTKENGRGWHPNSVSRVWRLHKAKIGIDRKVRFHDLRHTFASHLAMQGKPLEVVGNILGHKNPTTTKRYVHFTPEFLKETMRGFRYDVRKTSAVEIQKDEISQNETRNDGSNEMEISKRN